MVSILCARLYTELAIAVEHGPLDLPILEVLLIYPITLIHAFNFLNFSTQKVCNLIATIIKYSMGFKLSPVC